MKLKDIEQIKKYLRYITYNEEVELIKATCKKIDENEPMHGTLLIGIFDKILEAFNNTKREISHIFNIFDKLEVS